MANALRTYLQTRLEALQKESDAGKAALTRLDQQRAATTELLQRIDGAMIVIRETLAQPEETLAVAPPSAAPETPPPSGAA